MDILTICGEVIYIVKVGCITPIDGIYFSLLIADWLIALIIGQLRCDSIGLQSITPWCYWLWRLKEIGMFCSDFCHS